MTAASEIEKLIGRKVLIDSNIIIYLTDVVEPYYSMAKSLFSIVEAGETEAVISILSIGEVMQGPMRNGRIDIALEVRDYLLNFPNCHCQQTDIHVLEQIGTDQRIDWSGLRTVDSLIIASGLYNKVDAFVSNDNHFKKCIPGDLILSLDLL